MTTEPPRERGIVCLSTNHWSGLPTGKQHLMDVAAKSRPVLYVDPPIDLFSVLGRRRRWPELRRLRPMGAGLHVMSSTTVRAGSDPGSRALFYERSVARVQRAGARLGLAKPVVWAFAPEHVVCGGRLEESLFVYQASDEPTAVSKRPDVTRAYEERMLDEADLVFVVSEALLRARSRAGKTFRLPNAADRAHYARVLVGDPEADEDAFAEAVSRRGRGPATPAAGSRPLILYGGAAYHWFDNDLLFGAARLRPEWTFLLVGPLSRVLRRSPRPGNVIAVGRKTYDDFARYVAACDAAVLPWKAGPFSENADPIVLYEYLLCGKPVVATAFPAALERSEFVRVAGTASEFVDALDAALTEDVGLESVRARVAFGYANTWEHRAARALDIIDSAVKRGGRT